MPISSFVARLPALGSAPARWKALREFFAYHGVWAPGVKLLRLMTIRSKVMMLMAIVAAPTVPLTWSVVREQQATVTEARRQLSAVDLAGSASNLAYTIHGHGLHAAGPAKPAAEAILRAADELRQAYVTADALGVPVRKAWETCDSIISPALESVRSTGELTPRLQMEAELALVHLRSAVVELAAVGVTDDPALHAGASLSMELLPALQSLARELRRSTQRTTEEGGHGAAADRLGQAMKVGGVVANARMVAARSVRYLPLARFPVSPSEPPLGRLEAYLGAVEKAVSNPDVEPDAATLEQAFEPAIAQVHALRVATLSNVVQVLQRQESRALQMRNWVYAGLAVSFGLALYLVYTFFLVMRGGLGELKQQMTRMAQGDLSARPAPLGVDEVALTMQQMTASLVRLSDLMAAVQQGVGAVTQASKQVAAGNGELSQRSREASEALASVVEGVSRCASQLETCGRKVESLVGTVQTLRLESARNRKQMQRLRERMAALRSNSREIGEIVTLIDAIAFRTNILALNASVEASKAGESGRGFAVVAQEVRNLALRGAQSARRIGTIVSRSTDDIDLSRALAEEAGKSLAESDLRVDEIHRVMDEVAALTRGGGKESADVLAQVTGIRNGTVQNLKLVEDLASASGALRAQGEGLAQKIGRFTLS